MPRGGRREGAGRKPGSKLTKSQLIAAEIRDTGVSPLEVQLTTMRELWRRAHANGEMDANLAAQACAIAKDCAPYVHPRLASIEHANLGDSAPSGPLNIQVQFVRSKHEAPTIDIEPQVSPEVARLDERLEVARAELARLKALEDGTLQGAKTDGEQPVTPPPPQQQPMASPSRQSWQELIAKRKAETAWQSPDGTSGRR
jgi:hypothetical protein